MDRSLPADLRTYQQPAGRQDPRRSSSVPARRDPPVISRTGIGVSSAAAERPAPRRRVDVPLSAPGAEIRLPAVPAVGNKWRLLSGMITAALLLAMVFLLSSDAFRVGQVEVSGIQRLNQVEISRAIAVTGKPVFLINPDQIIRDLQLTFPGLSDIEVKVNWPARVEITLQERAPVLAWNWDGHVRWVDQKGVAFEPHDAGGDILQVKSSMLPPTVENRFVDPRIVNTVQALSGLAPEGVPMIFDEEHGLGWKDPRGWQVYFGFNDDDAAMKLVVYQAVVDYLQEKGITPAVINVEYLEAPYFRMEP